VTNPNSESDGVSRPPLRRVPVLYIPGIADHQGHFSWALANVWYVIFLPFSIHITIANTPVEDGSAFLIIVYAARHRDTMRVSGMRGLLDTVVGDATVYFLLIFTGHILVILFEFFTPVSDHLVDLCSSTDCKLDTANNS